MVAAGLIMVAAVLALLALEGMVAVASLVKIREALEGIHRELRRQRRPSAP